MPVAATLRRRLPAPLRGAARRARALRDGPADALAQPESWLRALHGERLDALDAAVAAAGDDDARDLTRFRELDADVWALLLTQEHTRWPHLTAVLPSVPDPALQRLWVGTSGMPLAAQSAAFYRRLAERFAEHGRVPLRRARVLDFGCGWGRLTRVLARDVGPGRLFGCDPVDGVLDECRRSGIRATFARSEFLPERVPFDGRFDLAYAFSVFTHLSEPAHERCLAALHAALAPGGVLVATIRPPAYLAVSEHLRPALEALGPDPQAALEGPRYLFAPHDAGPDSPLHAGGARTYGEAVVTPAYVRERWAPAFRLLAIDLLLADPHQVMLALRAE